MTGDNAHVKTVNKDQHNQFIKHHLPDWLLAADTPTRALFRSSYNHYLASQRAVAGRLKHLKSPEAFARPLLELVLLTKFDTALDIDSNFIKIAHVHSHLFGLFSTSAAATHQTLLQAALQNFEASETQENGFIEGSMLYAKLGTDGWHSLRPKPEQFAQVCRTLDLGAQYQHHIQSLFRTATPAQPWLHTDLPRVDFIDHEKSTFALLTYIAKMKSAISPPAYALLLRLIAGEPGLKLQGAPITLSSVSFLNTELTGPVMICADTSDSNRRQQCIGYIPGDTGASIKEYISVAHFEARLSELIRVDKDTFLLRYVPLRQRSTFRQALASYYPNSTSLALTPLTQPIFEHLHQQRLARILDDARLLAVPAEEVDKQARNRRIQTLENAGWTLASLAVSLIPGVGEVMLAMTAAHLLKQVYNGVEAWAHNDLSMATEYLLDVTDSIAEMAVTSVAGSAVITQLRAIDMPRFVANLTPVTLPSGVRRLWNIDLSPYQQALELPITAFADKQGLYALDDQRYLKLDQQLFEVTRDHQNGPWRVKHPTDKDAFSPPLVHNGYGAWRLKQERPLTWNMAKLIERLGLYGANLEAENIDLVMASTDVSTTMLQRVHTDCLVPPGLMMDALKRMSLDHQIISLVENTSINQAQTDLVTLFGFPPGFNSPSQAAAMKAYVRNHRAQVFEMLYQQSEISHDALTQAIRGSYSTMPTSLVDELIATTSPAEQLHLLSSHQLPSPLKSEADALMTRLNTGRVYEGLYLDSVSSEQSDLLAFSIFEHLADWPAPLNLEMRQNTADGPVLASTGGQPSSPKRIVIKQGNAYQALDIAGNPVGQSANIYSALYNSLSEPERNALKLSSLAPSRELKRLIAHTRLQAYSSLLTRRHLPAETFEPSEVVFPSAQPLDVNFASQEALAGIAPRSDGIYQGIYQVTSDISGLTRDYIKVHAWTFQVQHSNLGWRLIDARNPLRSYKPLLRRTSDGSWELDPQSGLKGGTPGIGGSKLIVDDSSTDLFVTAPEHPWVEYTERESAIMRSHDNYQHARNQPGTYERADNGRYPLRDLRGNALRIRAIQTAAKSSTSRTLFSSALIRPYIQWEGYEAVASLYEEKMQLRIFTEADMQIPGERLLIGQSMVTARIQLRKGEVLGVYSGELMPYHIALTRKDPYIIDVMTKKPSAANPRLMPVVLSGTNILSRINTNFEYLHDKPIRQAPGGYNVEAVPFVVDTVSTEGTKTQYFLTAMFASEDIGPGTELRWNYEYTEHDIRKIFP